MRERGFSLVELLAVIAITGTLLALATLNFGSYLRKSQVEAQVKELYADVQELRMKAAFTKRRHSVEFSAGQAVFRSYSSEADPSGSLLSTKRLPFAVTANWAAPNRIDFDTKGMMSDPANVKVICLATSENAVYDALIVTPVTTNIGKVTNRGAACAITNVKQK